MNTAANIDNSKPTDTKPFGKVDISSYPPMLQQYIGYKEKYPDALLMFQVGDFYELFFEDAVITSKALSLTLTSRDKSSPDPIPMCGVPVAVIDNYIEKLVNLGYSAAIVSQAPAVVENGKTIISRKLERIVTPGVRILGLHSDDHNEGMLAALSVDPQENVAIAISNVQTGVITIVENLTLTHVQSELSRFHIKELILPNAYGDKKVDRRLSWVTAIERILPTLAIKFRSNSLFQENHNQRNYSQVDGYSERSEIAKKAIRMLVSYLDETTVTGSLPIHQVTEQTFDSKLSIDSMTRVNLELVQSLRTGQREGSFLSAIDRTVSPCGRRLIRNWVLTPSTNLDEINSRYDVIEYFKEASLNRRQIRETFKFVPDLERIAARTELLVVLPKELAALRDTLRQLPKIQSLLDQVSTSSLLQDIASRMTLDGNLLEALEKTLSENPEPTLAEGGVIRDGVDAELDRLREIKGKGKTWIAELEALERQRTGISSLKIKYNGVLGYFIEITSANKHKAPEEYIRRQSTANSERFTTPDLKLRESDVLGAESKQIGREREIYENLKGEVLQYVGQIRRLAGALAELDVLVSFSELSDLEGFIRPEVDKISDLVIEDGKHVVLMQMLRSGYVPTSIELKNKSKKFLIITGANMGGKSTYLRQTALIVIMAQMGCFVPARSARIGIVDKLFARLGASDNQSEGESTFMVEMREASHIVSRATQKSLVLIDEIGRGTATADGLAIAQAIVEWLVEESNSRVLFATHFHELTTLENDYPLIANCSVASYEKNGQVIFTHHIKPGPANRSYGLDVAKLAGLPKDLIVRAQQLLLESAQKVYEKTADVRQLSIFSNAANEVSAAQEKENQLLASLREKLQVVDVNNLTPIQALHILNELSNEINKHQ